MLYTKKYIRKVFGNDERVLDIDYKSLVENNIVIINCATVSETTVRKT